MIILTAKEIYEKLKGDFSRHFLHPRKISPKSSCQMELLHFDPNTDDIEVFLRNVQETAKQLEYREATVVNMIKSKMPLAMYSTLFDIHELDKVVTRCRDIYAKSIDATAESLHCYRRCSCSKSFLLPSKMNSSSWMMGLLLLRSRSLLSPMSPH